MSKAEQVLRARHREVEAAWIRGDVSTKRYERSLRALTEALWKLGASNTETERG